VITHNAAIRKMAHRVVRFQDGKIGEVEVNEKRIAPQDIVVTDEGARQEAAARFPPSVGAGISIALVLACGVAVLLISFGMYGALENTAFRLLRAQPICRCLRLGDPRAAHAGKRNRGYRGRLGGRDCAPSRTRSSTCPTASRRRSAGHLAAAIKRRGPERAAVAVGSLPDPDSSGEIMVNEPFARGE
jgi:hypothetical protein